MDYCEDLVIIKWARILGGLGPDLKCPPEPHVCGSQLYHWVLYSSADSSMDEFIAGCTLRQGLVRGVAGGVSWKGVSLSLAPLFALSFLAAHELNLLFTRPFGQAFSAMEPPDHGLKT